MPGWYGTISLSNFADCVRHRLCPVDVIHWLIVFYRVLPASRLHPLRLAETVWICRFCPFRKPDVLQKPAACRLQLCFLQEPMFVANDYTFPLQLYCLLEPMFVANDYAFYYRVNPFKDTMKLQCKGNHYRGCSPIPRCSVRCPDGHHPLVVSICTPDTIRKSTHNLLACQVQGGHYPLLDMTCCDTRTIGWSRKLPKLRKI